MGFLDKLFGADESDKPPPKEATDDLKAERAAAPASSPPRAAEPQGAKRAPAAPAGVSPAEIAEVFGGGARVSREIWNLAVTTAVEHVERTKLGFEQVIEGVQTLTGMLQAMAKSEARWDQERKQQTLDLRAHLTTETDRLIASMRDDVARETSIEVFKAILPALDEVDHVLQENEVGSEVRAESIRILRRRLRDALSRLGSEETPIAKRETAFDAELHEGRPYEGDPEAVAGLAPRVVVDVERNGWTGFGKVLRHALVTVVKE